ncbi:MAG: hypothetical protein PHW63_11035 [Alphaproteobacteria bacterium]|nr:hypothetical protein [Alphaproteobacteria bacterium]
MPLYEYRVKNGHPESPRNIGGPVITVQEDGKIFFGASDDTDPGYLLSVDEAAGVTVALHGAMDYHRRNFETDPYAKEPF